MPTAVLVMGCGLRSGHGRDQIRLLHEQARRRGLDLIGAEKPANLSFADASRFSALVPCEVEDAAAAAATMKSVDAKFAGVLAFRDLCVEPLAEVARTLGIPAISPAAARTTRNKDLSRDRLREAGLPQPAAALVRDVAEAREFLDATPPGPWILKPRDGMGSAQVDLVRSAADLEQAFDGRPQGSPALIEEFVPGPEFSADGVVVGGVPVITALAQKSMGPSFVETGHRIPADLSDAQTALVDAQMKVALPAVGLTRGPFHVEFWTNGTGVVLGEIHARPGGAFIPTMAEYARPGLEMYGLYLDDVLGRPAQALPPTTRSAGMRHLIVRPPGRLASVSGWDEAVSVDQCVASGLLVGPGDRIGPVTWSADRHGFVVVEGASGAEVDAGLDRIESGIGFEVTEEEPPGPVSSPPAP
ncbi:ATP-grasp domain-containing protein [Streptomyces sindenensis]|uniref:ATP-grasp domain-containing protein n=1 Tax=Streptomyces sindenensis TaxID=67363 RepID=UPI001673BF99|nr:ATP-grasp domain-containing protein [Streptomyces sindenensis]GGP35702.1 argininosuccinate lyase [Streptomyces sindenensis]